MRLTIEFFSGTLFSFHLTPLPIPFGRGVMLSGGCRKRKTLEEGKAGSLIPEFLRKTDALRGQVLQLDIESLSAL